jgi:transposase-like protein
LRRQRLLATQAGDVQLRIPKLRKGSFFPLGQTVATPEASSQMLAALVTSALTPPRPRKLLVRAPGAVPASP